MSVRCEQPLYKLYEVSPWIHVGDRQYTGHLVVLLFLTNCHGRGEAGGLLAIMANPAPTSRRLELVAVGKKV